MKHMQRKHDYNSAKANGIGLDGVAKTLVTTINPKQAGVTREPRALVATESYCRRKLTVRLNGSYRLRLWPEGSCDSESHYGRRGIWESARGLHIWQLSSAQGRIKLEFSSSAVALSYSTCNRTYLCTPCLTTALLLSLSYYYTSCLPSSYL